MLGRLIRDLFRRPPAAQSPVQIVDAAARAPAYRPEVFTVPDTDQAKAIILTPEGGLTTEQRWETETPYLCSTIGAALGLDSHSLLLDYGCGIGRVSKALIEQFGCEVIGVDISQSMRQLAPGYVGQPSFSAVSPETFGKMADRGLRVDCAIAIWVLQHCPAVAADIALIKSSLKKNGLLFVLNNTVPAIPTDRGWVNTGVNIRQLLESEFTVEGYSRLPATATAPLVSEHSFMAQLRNDKV